MLAAVLVFIASLAAAGGVFSYQALLKGSIVKQQESLEIYNVSAKAVLENLFDSGAAIPLKVY